MPQKWLHVLCLGSALGFQGLPARYTEPPCGIMTSLSDSGVLALGKLPDLPRLLMPRPHREELGRLVHALVVRLPGGTLAT